MKYSLMLLAMASALALSGYSAEAGCADPGLTNASAPRMIPPLVLRRMSVPQQHVGQSASQNIVGSWMVTYTVEGSPFAQAYIQWHSDGTEWENIDLPINGGNICLGSWKSVDRKHVSRYHVGWLYTKGKVSGYFTETETDKVTGDGTYAGDNEQKLYDLDGNLLADVTGTSSAVFISP